MSPKGKVEEETTAILRVAARESSSQAVRSARSRGLTLTVVSNGCIVQEAPNGTQTTVKQLTSPRTTLAKGQILTYR
mgnify:CR=1 FL=1